MSAELSPTAAPPSRVETGRGPSGFRRTPRERTTVALVGNPNSGKSTLFNALTGLRADTANFTGTTVERKSGAMDLGSHHLELLDLPGLYSLRATTLDEQATHDILMGLHPGQRRPDAVILLVDATNLQRHLFLVGQVLALDMHVVVALNMMDELGDRRGDIDPDHLAKELDCPVIPISARTGEGLDNLRATMSETLSAAPPCAAPIRKTPSCAGCSGCVFQSGFAWSEDICSRTVKQHAQTSGATTDRLDRILTHPVAGLAAFLGAMMGIFFLIFQLASVPMDLIDGVFGQLGGLAARVLPDGWMESLVVDGVLAGIGGILVFLPQICILFYLLALLEDSGYLARAALVIDRYMRRVGLPGTAFVPLLSAHACAVPAIMSSRIIEDRRDRLVTILIAPLMSCSARIPVYVMLTALLFPDRPLQAALTFGGAYFFGLAAAMGMAFLFKRTLLKGESKPLVLELPPYRMPCFRKALRSTYDRGRMFVVQAGTVILLISLVLWALATFPSRGPSGEVDALRVEAVQAGQAGDAARAGILDQEAASLESRQALEHSVAGRLGRVIEPAIRPLGFDWQIGIGILSSFAAREVVVSTLAVVYGVGEPNDEASSHSFYDTLRRARRTDGSPVFTMATCTSLLVFYILAMQCLPTQAITRKETGSWKWPLLQLGYMTALAYGAAFVAYRLVLAFG